MEITKLIPASCTSQELRKRWSHTSPSFLSYLSKIIHQLCHRVSHRVSIFRWANIQMTQQQHRHNDAERTSRSSTELFRGSTELSFLKSCKISMCASNLASILPYPTKKNQSQIQRRKSRQHYACMSLLVSIPRGIYWNWIDQSTHPLSSIRTSDTRCVPGKNYCLCLGSNIGLYSIVCRFFIDENSSEKFLIREAIRYSRR